MRYNFPVVFVVESLLVHLCNYSKCYDLFRFICFVHDNIMHVPVYYDGTNDISVY